MRYARFALLPMYPESFGYHQCMSGTNTDPQTFRNNHGKELLCDCSVPDPTLSHYEYDRLISHARFPGILAPETNSGREYPITSRLDMKTEEMGSDAIFLRVSYCILLLSVASVVVIAKIM